MFAQTLQKQSSTNSHFCSICLMNNFNYSNLEIIKLQNRFYRNNPMFRLGNDIKQGLATDF